MAQDETWSWGKFFKGFITGKNYAKAIVLMFCMVVILAVGFSIYSTIKSKFSKPIPPPVSQTVGTNSGTINTTNDTSTTSITHYHFPLSDLFNLFQWRRIDKEPKTSS